MIKEEKRVLSKPAALREIQSRRGSEVATPDTDELFNGFLLRSNLIRRAGVDDVAFTHNSLRDYLAGIEFATSGDYKYLVEKVRGPERATWESVLKLACLQKDQESFAFRVVAALLDFDLVLSADNEADYRLALYINNELKVTLPVETRKRLVDVGEKYVSALLDGMLAPEISSVEQVELIAAQGVSSIAKLRHVAGRSAEVAAACVRELAKFGHAMANDLIAGYFADDSPLEVLEALASAVGYEAFAMRRNVLELPSVVAQIAEVQPIPLELSRHILDLSPLQITFRGHTLNLDYTQVASLEPLAGLTDLANLWLDNTPISNIKPLSRLTHLSSLSLESTQITNVEPLAGLTNLFYLYLSNTRVRNLEPLAGLIRLSHLHISNTPITSLAPLAGLVNLSILYLYETKVKDLDPLKGLTNLRKVHLSDTPMARGSAARLKRKRPQIEFIFEQDSKMSS